ncbi:hypothetical protein BST97_09490 [Nonlabens spongiae]|uniref:Viral A-type inclusion protein n=1 Tax=Nonlabens spongiae TaxID=331648 RepID=A0A1W6MKT5_9FLAO|nr:hypothetical protein [Nonlabens spongiae]ARN78205.1 hypothetical protein BST97_09490 [Nonlabens spongiae]
MNSIVKYFFAVLLLGLISCKNDPKVEAQSQELENEIAQYDALMEEAIEVHDDVMPKMGRLMELSEMMDQQIKKDSTISEFKIAKEKLNAAHDDMMTWMREYSEQFPYGEESPATAAALDQKMPVLEEKVEEIKRVKTETENVITYAQNLMKKVAVDDFKKDQSIAK